MFVFIILWVRAEPSWMSCPASIGLYSSHLNGLCYIVVFDLLYSSIACSSVPCLEALYSTIFCPAFNFFIKMMELGIRTMILPIQAAGLAAAVP